MPSSDHNNSSTLSNDGQDQTTQAKTSQLNAAALAALNQQTSQVSDLVVAVELR